MNRYKRTDRVSTIIHRAVSEIIENDIRDTRKGMVTVTDVQVAKDFKTAKIFVSVLGDSDQVKKSVELLNNAAGFIRAKLGDMIIIRYVPSLKFYYDASTVTGMKMDSILKELNTESIE